VVRTAADVLYAAGLGMDCRHVSEGAGQRIALRWESV
jgi:tRNA(Ile)-lysidine synthase